MNNFTNPAEKAIAAFGGGEELAEAAKVTPSAVSQWKRRGIIPAERLALILTSAAQRDIDLKAADLIRWPK